MSNFTKIFSIDTKFENDDVHVVMMRMKRKHALKIIQYITRDETTGNITVTFKNQFELLNAAADFLPDYTKELAGLTDADGNALKIEEVIDELYFIELTTELITKLMEKSFMKVEQAKKLDAPQENSMEDTKAIQDSPLPE